MKITIFFSIISFIFLINFANANEKNDIISEKEVITINSKSQETKTDIKISEQDQQTPLLVEEQLGEAEIVTDKNINKNTDIVTEKIMDQIEAEYGKKNQNYIEIDKKLDDIIVQIKNNDPRRYDNNDKINKSIQELRMIILVITAISAILFLITFTTLLKLSKLNKLLLMASK